MREYDAVILRLAARTRADEEALTDLLNERSRAGWTYHSSTTLGTTRLLAVFWRETE